MILRAFLRLGGGGVRCGPRARLALGSQSQVLRRPGLRPRGIRRRVIRKDALEGFDQIEHADLESGLFA